MHPRQICAKCGGRMKEGFIPEAREYSGKITTWFAGKPRAGLFGLKLRGLERYQVQSWRCEKCGLLESYATGR